MEWGLPGAGWENGEMQVKGFRLPVIIGVTEALVYSMVTIVNNAVVHTLHLPR